MAKRKPAKNLGGRPRLPDARRLIFCTRLTEGELEAVQAAAEAAGKAPRVWARDRILRGLTIPRA